MAQHEVSGSSEPVIPGTPLRTHPVQSFSPAIQWELTQDFFDQLVEQIEAPQRCSTRAVMKQTSPFLCNDTSRIIGFQGTVYKADNQFSQEPLPREETSAIHHRLLQNYQG